MRKLGLLIIGLVVLSLAMPFSFAAKLAKVEGVKIDETEDIEEGGKYYTRCNLAYDRKRKVYWHNMSLLEDRLAPETEIIIKNATPKGIVFYLANDEDSKYVIATPPKKWNKFFVKSKDQIGLNRISKKAKANLVKAKVAVGMTKKEVLIVRGCPAYSAFGKNTYRESLEDILESNSWYYSLNKRINEYIVKFEKGKVSRIDSF